MIKDRMLGCPYGQTVGDTLIEAYRRIRPREVMLYSIDRQTPARKLEKVSREELQAIAERITRETGVAVVTA